MVIVLIAPCVYPSEHTINTFEGVLDHVRTTLAFGDGVALGVALGVGVGPGVLKFGLSEEEVDVVLTM